MDTYDNKNDIAMKKSLTILFIAFAGGIAGHFVMSKLSPEAVSEEKVVERVVYETAPVRYTSYESAGVPLDFTLAAESTVNTVVHVRTETTVKNSFHHPWFDFFGYENTPQIQRGSGSGVIISDDGYIVTNNHVIDGAQSISVSLNNNTTHEATVVGTDPATDIAVLKIDAYDLPTIRFGDSDELRVGEWVLAVGNPFDLTSTVTAGIVSAKARNINLLRGDVNREIFPIESFIQTDAAVNPGNSGGALVNTRGELIGINTAIASRTGSYAGYSFAVPTSIVSKVTADLMEFGLVQRAFIGVRISEVTQELAAERGLNRIEGVYVADLVDNGAAALAGIKEGDIILRVGKASVRTVPELQERISRYRPGDEVNVTVWRDKREVAIPVILRNQSGSTELRDADREATLSALGASLDQVPAEELKKLNLSGGAKVTRLSKGKFAEAGIQRDFIITQIDGVAIKRPEDVVAALQGKTGGVLVEGVYPNGRKAYYGFGM